MSDEFFVGYLPTPSQERRFLWIIGAALIVGGISLATILSAIQRDPGGGAWNLDQVVQIEGVLRASPYPMLETPSQTFLLVGEGKAGASDRAATLDGQTVLASGYRISRKALSILELDVKTAALRVVIQSSISSVPRLASKWVSMTVQGEIVDSKCFAGAMKPGDGKTHKACASLCIRGGIPPMLICFDQAGQQSNYLLTSSAGNAFTGTALEELLGFVGDSVEVSGTAEQPGGVRSFGIFRVGAVRRI